MSKIKPFKSKASVQQEAALWIIELDKGDLNQSNKKDLQRWLAQSKSNKREFMELAELWELADLLPDYAVIDTSKAVIEKNQRFLWHPQQAVAACIIVLCVFSGALFWLTSPGRLTASPENYHTAIGEIREISLADGSVISLNTNSRIKVAYSPQRRRVFLHSGEANFKVAKDKQRPFSVEVGDSVVTAVGTAFNIRKSGHSANLIVTEGQVSVGGRTNDNHRLPSAVTEEAPLMVVAGEEINIEPKAPVAADKSNPKDLERKLSWTSGMLSFDNTPLEQVIAEVSRYTETKIIISDETLKTLKVGGYFKAGETESMLEVLQLSFNIKVQVGNDNVVLLKNNDSQRAIQ